MPRACYRRKWLIACSSLFQRSELEVTVAVYAPSPPQYPHDGLSQVKRRVNREGHSLQTPWDGERNLVGFINEKGERNPLKFDKL